MDDLFFLELAQGHLHHAHRAVDDFLAGVDDRLGLLAAEHQASHLRRVGQVGQPGPFIDEMAARSELASSSRNLALAHFLKEFGNLRRPAQAVVKNYVRQCSIMMTCVEVAKAGLFLAQDGRGTQGAVISRSEAKRIGSIMLTCGMYDAAGEFAYRVGLPGKSGVGGGILAVVPGECVICVWSPRLDSKGNSLAGTAALADLSDRTGWSIF